MNWHSTILQNKELKQAEQELKILEDDVAAAYSFLRKNRQGYFGGKKRIPLYLLLGPAHFGKTTILAQAGLNLKNFNQQNLKDVTPTKYCSFWFSQDALYIDTAGAYTKPDITNPRNDLIWQGFIKLLQKYFGKDAIAGVLIILDLPTIANDITLLKNTLFCIRERVYELATFIKNLPIHIILTKCDLIAGFLESFALLSTKERLEPFGIAFTDPKEAADPILAFETKFNELLKLLNARVIERMQKATSPEERQLIKNFPSQLSNLKHVLLEILSNVPSGQHISLLGIYFTSSIQRGVPIDFIKNSLLTAFSFKEKPTYPLEASNNYSYFVENVFKKVIVTLKIHQRWQLFHPNYPYALITVTLIISATSIIGYKNYCKNAVMLNKIARLLQQQEPLTNLDNFDTAINQLDHAAKSWWFKLGINEVKLPLQALHKKFQNAFLQTIILQLENHLNSLMNSQDVNTQPKRLYNALQTYLMLGTPDKLDSTYVKNWFATYWSEAYNHTQKLRMQQQLTTILSHKPKITLNQQLIDTVRNNLLHLPPIPLFYLLLENSYDNQNIDLGLSHHISKMYTKEQFNKIYNEDIPEIVNQPPQQDWVLGNLELTASLQKTPPNEIIKGLRETYIERYVATWETTVTSLQPKTDCKNLNEVIQNLTAMATNNSPFLNLLQQIKTNTTINNVPPELLITINAKLQKLNITNPDNVQQNLTKLAHYFSTLVQQPDVNKAAFDVAIGHIQNEPSNPLTTFKTFTNLQTQPLQEWLQPIIKNIWSVLLETSQYHINNVWHTTIIPQYQKMIVNKYPLFKDSKDDLSLDDFMRFFGPNGIMEDFFNKYINPFVNMDKTNWTWKDLEGSKISFSQDSLEVFLRATLIQKMFFPAKTLEPKVRFTLTPLGITPHTQGFTLHLEGQKVIFINGEKKQSALIWPGPNPGLVTIDFINNQGKYYNSSQFGPWAWFRILDKSNVISLNSTKRFELTFDLNGNAAKYELTTDESINPFIPEIINNFRCPDQLN